MERVHCQEGSRIIENFSNVLVSPGLNAGVRCGLTNRVSISWNPADARVRVVQMIRTIMPRTL